GGKRVDIVLEMVGGSTFDASLSALAPFGRVITYGMASREMATPVNPALLCKGSKTVAGFWLAHCFGNPALLNEPLAELFALVASGAITPVIGETFALTDARAAHIAMRARQTTGKVVLDPTR
ncbi:MAG: zinc-binding dehydrogenase, partial [Actinobacteria bacterium]|nr:zinc-binding dehydrogenase [Actinomycetota bacterium]